MICPKNIFDSSGCSDIAARVKVHHSLLQAFERLGLPVAQEKLEGPTTGSSFLGFDVNTMALELGLPQVKPTELLQTVISWLSRTDCQKKVLESLHGQVTHASKVVKLGKTFTCCLIELFLQVSKNHITISGV